MIRLVVACVIALVPSMAVGQALTVEGKTYEDTLSTGGKTLYRLGAGLREKWMLDVYVMAAYSESGKCDPTTIIESDEAKVLRLDMLRDVSAEKMAATIGGAFVEHMPKYASPELAAQRKTFESYFKSECTKGTTLEFTYLPGIGTTLKQNGAALGPPLTGRAFMTVLWDIYFGKASCCEDLRDQILKGCR